MCREGCRMGGGVKPPSHAPPTTKLGRCPCQFEGRPPRPRRKGPNRAAGRGPPAARRQRRARCSLQRPERGQTLTAVVTGLESRRENSETFCERRLGPIRTGPVTFGPRMISRNPPPRGEGPGTRKRWKRPGKTRTAEGVALGCSCLPVCLSLRGESVQLPKRNAPRKS